MLESEYLRSIAAAVSPNLPDGIVLKAPGPQRGIEIVLPPGMASHGFRGLRRETDGDFELSAEQMEEWALDALNLVQDLICETYREPWPNRGVAPVPHPEVEVSEREVRMWFGDRTHPVLEFAPVPIE